MTQQEKSEELKDIFETEGYDVLSYSGRGMFGERCLAVKIKENKSPISVCGQILESLLTEKEFDKALVLAKALQKTNQDSFGLGSVLYFPSFKYEEDFEDEDEEPEVKPRKPGSRP